MLKITPAEYAQYDFPERLIKNKASLDETCELEVAGGIKFEFPLVRTILHLLIWRPLTHFGIPPRINEVFLFENITDNVLTDCHDAIYKRLLEVIPRKTVYDHMPLLEQVFHSIDAVGNFAMRHCQPYMNSFSALSLAKMMAEPEFKKAVDVGIDPKAGTWIVEPLLNQATAALRKIISSRNKLSNNVLINFAETNSLKINSLSQALIMYGPRSDIDDTVSRHIVQESSFSGLRSVKDFAIESFSAKKSQYLKTDAIKRAQYSSRCLKIACAVMRRIYPSSCGNLISNLGTVHAGHCGAKPLLVPHTIHHKHMDNYLDKVIYDNNKRVILTPNNIRQYADTTVRMVSPFGCLHTDGMCEACAGRGDMNLLAYLPPNIHIGIMAASILGSRVSQKILSAKHLSGTDTIEYTLPDLATKYFYKTENKLHWHRDVFEKNKNISVRIPIEAFGPLTDLNHDVLPDCEAFSEVPYFEILNGDVVVDTVQLATDGFVPYLSEASLAYMQENFNKLIIDDETETITIPLSKVNFDNEFMKYIVINDDMVAFTENVKYFMSNTINQFTSVTQAQQAFVGLLYRKANINFSYVETVLRAFSVANKAVPTIPVVTDPEDVKFCTMDVIARTSISSKLGHERLPQFFREVSSMVVNLQPSIFDPLYGFI